MKLREIASLVGGEILGDHDLEITGVSGISEAKEGDITFAASKKYLRDISDCRASCLMVKEPVPDVRIAQLKVSNPYLAFAQLLGHFYVKPVKFSGVSKSAHVSDTAKIGDNVSVLPFAYISDGVSVGDGCVIYPNVFIGENTIIGNQCTIHSNVTLRENLKIGNRVIIHAGTVIGSDGFGYVFEQGSYYKIPQVGGVIVGDDVEIGSNVSVDRATTGNTVIGNGTKIDNLSQIAHNVQIGSNSIIIAQVGIGGSSEIGEYVTLAGQVGVSDHTRVDPGTMIGAQSGVMGHVAKGAYSGSPAIPHRDWLKSQAIFARLPELHKKIKELEERIRELERGNQG